MYSLLGNHKTMTHRYTVNVIHVYNRIIVHTQQLLWGVHVHKLEHLQKKALRFMTNSGYISHTTPLLIKHG